MLGKTQHSQFNLKLLVYSDNPPGNKISGLIAKTGWHRLNQYFSDQFISHESALSGLALLARNFEFRAGQQRRILNLELLGDLAVG